MFQAISTKASKRNNEFRVLKCPPRIGEREIWGHRQSSPNTKFNQKTIVFVKNKDLPENVQIVLKVQYDEKYALPLHGSISQSTKTQLTEKQFL